MKIAIDLRPLQLGHENRGIGATIINLLQNFPKDNRYTYIFIRFDHSDPLKDNGLAANFTYDEVIKKKAEFSTKPAQLIKFIWSTLFDNYLSLSMKHPDVFFQTDYLLGIPRSRRMRKVVMSYDLIPMKLRPIYLPSWRKYYHQKQLRLRSRVRLVLHSLYYAKKYKKGCHTLKKADQIISISENTKKDILEIINVPESKITTIYLAPSFRKESESPRKHIVDLLNSMQPYLLFIGGTDRRRQLHELVYAFNLLRSRGYDIKLVLAGNEFGDDDKYLRQNPLAFQAIENSSYREDIIKVGRISESEKNLVMNHAFALVYPTLYEGFGLPIIEAFACGCTAVSYKNSSLTEIGKEYITFTRENNGNGLFESLEKLLKNNQKKQTVAAQKYAKEFTWDKTSREIFQKLLQAAH